MGHGTIIKQKHPITDDQFARLELVMFGPNKKLKPKARQNNINKKRLIVSTLWFPAKLKKSTKFIPNLSSFKIKFAVRGQSFDIDLSHSNRMIIIRGHLLGYRKEKMRKSKKRNSSKIHESYSCSMFLHWRSVRLSLPMHYKSGRTCLSRSQVFSRPGPSPRAAG